jgi:hypothetical protein
MTGFKVSVLVVGKVVGQAGIASYQGITQDGRYFTRSFSSNLGVNASVFGQPINGGRCLNSLQKLDLYLYRQANYTDSTAFVFSFTGNVISDLVFSYIYGVYL